MRLDLERLVGRAVVDKEFRDKLLADPEQAVQDAGFSLSDEEAERLKAGVGQTSSEQFDQQFWGGW